jgi:predicted component of viral defense system (DUF524 family)
MKKNNITVTNNRCPYCDYDCNLSAQLTENKESFPVEGDYSVCLKCTQVSVFDDKCQLRLPSKAEEAAINKDIEVATCRKFLLEMDRSYVGKK